MPESVVGPWAKDKLDRLRKYLNAYTTIMKRQTWCDGYHYIDAFAGPGERQIREAREETSQDARQVLLEVANFGQEQEEQKQFLAGSPRVALDVQHPFTNYIFIEQSPIRVAALRELDKEYGRSRRIVIRQMDCNQYLQEKLVNNPRLDWTRNRAIIFLDPFGMQVSWTTIAAVAATRGIEIFLNFPVGMAIQRLLRRNPESFTPAQRKKLDDYFGSPDWFTTVYRPRRTLFGNAMDEKVNQSGEALVTWYRERLRDAFGHVSHAALIRNTRQGHLYYLLLASPNKTGVKIADDILSAGETI